MKPSRLSVCSVVPGSGGLPSVVRQFCDKGDGIVTAFMDSALPICRQLVPEDRPVEVLAFGDVVRRVLTACGEETLWLGQSGHMEVAIADACRNLAEDSPFAPTARFPGLHRALARTMSELNEWGIDRHEMRRLAPLAAPRTGAKLHSMADIDESVDRVFETLGRQTHAAQMRQCLDSLLESDEAIPRMLVFAGAEDCPLRLRWLEWLAEQGTQVTVVVDRHATDVPIFGGARRTIETLGRGAEVRGDGNCLVRNLFAPDPQGGPGIDVAIVSAADPLAEVEWALRGCMAEDRPDQTGIYVRNLEAYAPLIESAAKRLGVDVRIVRRAPLLTNSFARLTLTALEFCASHDVRTLGQIAGSSYLGLDGAAQTRLRSGLRDAHTMRALQWDALGRWAVAHEEEYPWLVALLEWRERARANLTLREWHRLLTELIRVDERFPWSTSIMANDPRMGERDRRARHQLERLLSNYVSVEGLHGDRTHSLAEMAAVCRSIWSKGDVSIPTGDFGICVAEDPYTLTQVQVLHVLGMLEGVFPRRRTEDAILTDAEREEISALRPSDPRLLTSHDRAEAERDAFYRVCCVAARRVVFSYPIADDSRDNIPAFYLTEVRRAVAEKGVQTHNYPRAHFAPPAEECELPADLQLRKALEAPREYPLSVDLVSALARDAVRPAEGAKFEPRELRDALQCSFRYVLRHHLHVRVNRLRTRWQSLQSLPHAAGLPNDKPREVVERALMAALEAELDRLYSDVPDWEMPLLRAGGRRLIKDWLRREFTSRAIWPKEPAGLRQNVAFGQPGLRATMPGGVTLEGTIPGLSQHQRYTVAHLFDAGIRDPKHLADHEGLYLGLYLLALYESGREGAIEIDSMHGKRQLVVLSRTGGELRNHVKEGLSVAELATSDDPINAKRAFFEDVKRVLRRATDRIYESRVDPIQGDWCDVCDYGELCRRSRAFGEEDSPFGKDIVFEDE